MAENSAMHLLAEMEPVLNDGVYVFSLLPPDTDLCHFLARLPSSPLASFREEEGTTVVLAEEIARAHHLPILFRAAWITLKIQSELTAIGLTAAFASALSAAGISCNVIAACHHDHIFVPLASAERALAVLCHVQQVTRAARLATGVESHGTAG